jgi:hypothetical protein
VEDDSPGRFRAVDVGVIIGFITFGVGMFVLGRQTTPATSCCETLTQRDTELLLCETRLQAANLPPIPSLP